MSVPRNYRMNIQNKDINPLSNVLDNYQREIQHNEEHLNRDYNDDFEATSEYVETLPDLQNGEPSLIGDLRNKFNMSVFQISKCHLGIKVQMVTY